MGTIQWNTGKKGGRGMENERNLSLKFIPKSGTLDIRKQKPSAVDPAEWGFSL